MCKPDDRLEVGRIVGAGRIFIAVPSARYERCKTPLTDSIRHTVHFTRDEIPWLIAALQTEYTATRKDGE